ncbi:MAG TPA: zf-HC2 domain-containing protein [Bacteroidota bacterium]|nr:zf-HC2 domain-containing protein [Bacteroidota bacterium]
MKCHDVEYLLVELADGTLDAKQKASVEEHLAACEQCAMDAILIRETFAVLRTDVEELPPNHYFTTLLPKIRTRLEKKEHPWTFTIPVWLEKLAAPLTVGAMAMILVGLFRAFEPSAEYSPLKSIVEQVPGDEMASLVVTPAEMLTGSQYGYQANERVLEALPNANTLVESMKNELFEREMPMPQAEVGVQSVERTLDGLDDETVSQILDRLNEHTTTL